MRISFYRRPAIFLPRRHTNFPLFSFSLSDMSPKRLGRAVLLLYSTHTQSLAMLRVACCVFYNLFFTSIRCRVVRQPRERYVEVVQRYRTGRHGYSYIMSYLLLKKRAGNIGAAMKKRK